ncbi:MAG: type II toxin-antitoxin system VapC family toxin [Alphaproteobacteria bacterium]|nr:type II toxin-antitoxin system VapC family toxin [Alphaproteobacteria bacterium]
MRLLIDSNAFIWAYVRPAELSTAARRAIDDPAHDRFVSIAAIWEICIKLSTGKLSMPGGPSGAIEDLALDVLPISLEHSMRVQHLPHHHRDPFDRMMIAQAMEEGLTIVTRDRQFQAYGIPLLIA